MSEVQAARFSTKTDRETQELPELPMGWVWAKLGDVLSFEYGKGLPEKARDSAGSVAVYGSSGVVGQHSEALVTRPCLVIGRKGSAGNVLLSLSASWPIDTTYYAIPPEGLDLRYAFYALGYLDLGRLDKSTAVPSLSRDDAHARYIPIPPANEQHRIVEKLEELLSDLDAGVATLRQALAKLKRYRQAVLKAAVEGELSREWREANRDRLEPASKLLERILEHRRSCGSGGKKFKEPEPPDTNKLPELPKGWTWVRAQQLIYGLRSGSTLVPQDEPTNIPILRSSSVRQGCVDLDASRFLPETNPPGERDFLQEGDLLFVRLSGSAAYVGACALVPNLAGKRIAYPDRLFCARPVFPLLGHYVKMVFRTPAVRAFLEAKAKSTAGHKRVSLGDIEKQVFPLPPEEEIRWLVEEVDRRLSEADRLEATLRANLKRAERLRQAILKKAFSGELVPQNPEDEPASALLERIRASRAQAPKKGKRKQ